MKLKKFSYVEVKDQKDADLITRNQAKHNLHLVCEMTMNKKELNKLFDKYWYKRREMNYLGGIHEEQLY